MNKIIKWIEEERANGASWEDLMYAKQGSTEKLTEFLRNAHTFFHWPKISLEEWTTAVESERQKCEYRETLIDKKGATVIGGSNEGNLLTVPLAEDSAWQTYKRRLLQNGFGENTVELIEDSTIKTLRCLSRDTRIIGTVKGLVVGNVQSGKTANMAALMAMAADYGWNMFVILSGMMENLRLQTIRRLLSDLKGSKLDWESISNPKSVEETGKRLRDKDLKENSNKRYLSVCIKNKKRLENLIEWLAYDKAPRENIKMLIIDDECDQASINTSKDDRARINERILYLSNNKSSKGKDIKERFQAVNYVGYTATPYANVLNERPGEKSLYPKDFITSLNVSDKYFGPQQIFGYSGDDGSEADIYSGMDIVREIPREDVDEINDIQEGVPETLPTSLVESICWFICGVSFFRYKCYKKPVSMLIHTSRNVVHHNHLSEAVSEWFRNTPRSHIVELCNNIWDRESKQFTIEMFHKSYPNYALNEHIEIEPYPSFEELRPYIIDLLSIGLQKILINEDDKRYEFSNGIHLCVDNSEKGDDDVYKRLLYPEEDEMPELAPAFMVIGGNTLSRGLTLEGLVSTYFLRPAQCADTLMQMGRWFGYRQGYELIPRIWMTQNVKSQFEFMSEMDQRLRDEIRMMSEIGINPSEYGPKIMASPSAKWLQIVARNKRQAAVGADYDFAGHTVETGVFDNKVTTIENNMRKIKDFLLSLGDPSPILNNPYSDRNIVWKGILWECVKQFIKDFKYSERQRGFNEIDAFIKWMDKMTTEDHLKDWNVILAGVKGSDEKGKWYLSDEKWIYKVNRTQRTPNRVDGVLNIGTLRSFNDFLSDIDISSNDTQTLSKLRGIKHDIASLNLLREDLGVGNIPQLVIYIIDKDSLPQEGSISRFPLNAANDIAGFSINIPGYRTSRNTIQSIQIGLSPVTNFED